MRFKHDGVQSLTWFHKFRQNESLPANLDSYFTSLCTCFSGSEPNSEIRLWSRDEASSGGAGVSRSDDGLVDRVLVGPLWSLTGVPEGLSKLTDGGTMEEKGESSLTLPLSWDFFNWEDIWRFVEIRVDDQKLRIYWIDHLGDKYLYTCTHRMQCMLREISFS